MKKTIASIVLALAVSATSAHAQYIVSAVGGVVISGGTGGGTITDTFNKAGLSVGYTSGITNFDSYLAGNPTHTTLVSGFEWYSNFRSTSASVTYNLGSVQKIDRLALWNEESSGIGALDIYGSVDGVSFNLLSSGLAPTDNPTADYRADVFSFAATDMQYFRMDMSGCPQSQSRFPACAIGEVAFRTAGTVVPEPSTYALMGAGLLGLGFVSRRKRNI